MENFHVPLSSDDPLTRVLRLPMATQKTTINVERSENVHIGHVAHLHGPVVINQYLNHRPASQDDEESEQGVYNQIEALRIMESCGGSRRSKFNFRPYNFLPIDELRLITRTEWLARPSGPVDSLDTPVPHLILAHTGTEFCGDRLSCIHHMRYLQSIHVDDRRWSDIGFNFVVGGDGAVYEGRGWDVVGAHTRGHNRDSICVALLGRFESKLPPKEQLEAAKKIIELCVARGKLDEDYKLYGARQLIPTRSPGDALFAEIKTWPHFAERD